MLLLQNRFAHQGESTRLSQARSTLTGQSLIESCLVIFMVCLIFAGLFQISQLFAASEILHHAAARGARAKTVGLNSWMITKAVRVASIPNSGKLISPEFKNEDPALQNMLETMSPGQLWTSVLITAPSSTQTSLEKARIPEYLWSPTWAQANSTLDYADWDSVSMSDLTSGGSSIPDPTINIRTSQHYPLRMPLHRAFYNADFIRLEGNSYLDSHYSLYINDMGW